MTDDQGTGETPRIQVYCTVKADELQETEAGTVCLRCQRQLTELHPDKPAPSSGCGFIRLSRAPLIASSLALASCIKPSAETPTPPTPQPEPPKQESPILPGIMCPPPGENKIQKTDYPTAVRVPGKGHLIISPYTGKPVDIEGLPIGSLAMDPNFKAEEKKFFVIPPAER